MVNFWYFNEEWNEKEITANTTNSPGVVGGIKNANTGPQQEKVHKEIKTQK